MKKDLNYIDDLVKSKLDNFRVETPTSEFSSEWENLSRNLVENNLSTAGSAASAGKVGTTVFTKISSSVVQFVVSKIYFIAIAAVSTIGITIYTNTNYSEQNNNFKQEKPIVKDSTSTENTIEKENSDKELLKEINKVFEKIEAGKKENPKNSIKTKIEKKKQTVLPDKTNIKKTKKIVKKDKPKAENTKSNIKKIRKIIKVRKKIIVRDTLKYFDTLKTFKKR